LKIKQTLFLLNRNRMSGYAAWLSNPSALVGLAINRFGQQKEKTIEELTNLYRMNPVYVASNIVQKYEKNSSNPEIQMAAVKVKQAGANQHAAAIDVLLSYSAYIEFYKREKTSTNTIASKTFLETLMEDIFLYLYYTIQKNSLKSKFLALVGKVEPLTKKTITGKTLSRANSFTESRGIIYSEEIPLMPPKLIDGINEVLRANSAMASAYLLKPGIAAGSSSTAPSFTMLEDAEGELLTGAAYDAALGQIEVKAREILKKRAKNFPGASNEKKLSPSELQLYTKGEAASVSSSAAALQKENGANAAATLMALGSKRGRNENNNGQGNTKRLTKGQAPGVAASAIAEELNNDDGLGALAENMKEITYAGQSTMYKMIGETLYRASNAAGGNAKWTEVPQGSEEYMEVSVQFSDENNLGGGARRRTAKAKKSKKTMKRRSAKAKKSKKTRKH